MWGSPPKSVSGAGRRSRFASVGRAGVCAPARAPTEVNLKFERSAWLDAPFPSDDLRLSDGTINVSGFPNPSSSTLLSQALALVGRDARELRGRGGVFSSPPLDRWMAAFRRTWCWSMWTTSRRTALSPVVRSTMVTQFVGARGSGTLQLEQEAVELGFGQRVGAFHLERVLRRQHEERRVQPVDRRRRR